MPGRNLENLEVRLAVVHQKITAHRVKDVKN